MTNQTDISKITLVVAATVTFGFFVYNLIKSFSEMEFYLRPSKRRKPTSIPKDDDLMGLLIAIEEHNIGKPKLIYILSKLADQAAFTDIQNKINELGYLPKIVSILNHSDHDVKTQAALLINNLSLNQRNQEVLKNSIPQLINVIRNNCLDERTTTLFTAVLNALTNLATLDSSHAELLPFVHVLCELLTECDTVQIKLQVLKILVNLSTNDKLCENMLELDAQLLKSVEPYISSEVEEHYVLRAVSCCANVLTAVHRRWQFGRQPVVAAPEFVNENLRENLIRLTSHKNHDIRLQAGRSLIALRPPIHDITAESLDEIDILDVLKI